MSRDDYETELTASREEAAAVLSGVADGLLAGSIRLGDDADAVAVDPPEELSLEVELETEDDEVSLELEMEWSAPDGEAAVSAAEDLTETADDSTDESDLDETEADVSVPVGAADASQSLARFEVFRDQAEEWRWRLRHRNGNIIATSGEGYTQKHNAWNGLESVMQNAPEADVTDESTD